MKLDPIKAGLVAYAICALLTFGYSYNRDYEVPKSSNMNPLRAFMCAVVWPAYLSKVAFERMRP